MVVPVEHYMGMEVRFPYFPLPMPLVLMDGNLYRCHPEPLLESFPKFLQFFHGRILFDHDHALTERFRLSLHFAPGLFLDESGYLGATFSE